jgi:predicted enzyme related to lactoylglutathione lyase
MSGNPVVHFEIGCKDLSTITNFYSKLFGWTPTIPMASLLQTNNPEGIQGHITSLGHEPHNYTIFYIQIENINDSLAQIESAGGQKLIGPVTLPDGKQFAWFKDPEGNTAGLITK